MVAIFLFALGMYLIIEWHWCMLTITTDQLIIATAIPKITEEFNSLTELSWLVNGFVNLNHRSLQFWLTYPVPHLAWVQPAVCPTWPNHPFETRHAPRRLHLRTRFSCLRCRPEHAGTHPRPRHRWSGCGGYLLGGYGYHRRVDHFTRQSQVLWSLRCLVCSTTEPTTFTSR